MSLKWESLDKAVEGYKIQIGDYIILNMMLPRQVLSKAFKVTRVTLDQAVVEIKPKPVKAPYPVPQEIKNRNCQHRDAMYFPRYYGEGFMPEKKNSKKRISKHEWHVRMSKNLTKVLLKRCPDE